MPEFDYQKDVKINLDQLELDCQEQPEIFMKYAQEESRLRKKADLAHEDLKVTRSEIIKELLSADGKKPTGQEIEAAYRTDKRHIEAKKKFIDVSHDLSLAEIAVKGFYQRRDMLENEIKLLGMNYYSRVSKTNGVPMKTESLLKASNELIDNCDAINKCNEKTEATKPGRARRTRR